MQFKLRFKTHEKIQLTNLNKFTLRIEINLKSTISADGGNYYDLGGNLILI